MSVSSVDQVPSTQGSIKTRAFAGVGWATLARLSIQASRAVVNLVLAALLAPAAMGTVGLLNAIFSLGLVLTELGLNAAVIQRREVDETHLSTAFYLNLGFGVLWTGVCIIGAPLVGRFFDDVLLGEVLRVYAFVFIVAALSSVQRTLLIRELAFKRIAVADGVGCLVGGGLSVGLAWAGLGVWAIVWGEIAFRLISTVLLWFGSEWYPGNRPGLQAFRDLFLFSSGVLATRLLDELSRNLDVFILGKLVSASSLGIYTISVQVARFFPALIGVPLTLVMFPAFSELQADRRKLGQAFLYTTKYLALVTMPVMVGLILVAPQFVLAVLGEKWAGAIPVLRLLPVVGLMNGLGGRLWRSLLNAVGRSHSVSIMTFTRIVTLSVSTLVGARFGIVGVAAAFAIHEVLLRFVFQHIVNRQLEMGMGDYVAALWPAVRSTAVMSVAVILVQVLLAVFGEGPQTMGRLDYVWQLACMLLVGGLAFVFALRWLCREEFREMAGSLGRALATVGVSLR